MHTELTAGLSCYPKDHVQFLSAAIVLFWLVGTPAHASDQREVDKVEGWSVIHDPMGDGSCYAKRTYGNETSLSIGKIAPHATWAAIVSNSTWSPIQTGTFYEIRYVFDKKYRWHAKAVGTQDGLRSDDISEEFVDDFARASSLKLFHSDRKVDSLELFGTRAAVDAINQCYVSHTRKAGPYAPSDPIETEPAP